VGKDAETSMAIEVVGAVDVVAANPPSGMSPEDLGEARRRKINDIVIVLEKQAMALSEALSTRIRTHLPENEKANVALDFDLKEPTFVVRLPLSGPLDKTQQRELGMTLVDTVKATLGEYISERASRIGIWEPVVTAELVGNVLTAGAPKAASVPTAGWWLIAAIAGASLIAAIYIWAGH